MAFNEDLILFDYELFPSNEISSRLRDMQEGTIVKEEKVLLRRIVKEYDVVVLEKSRDISSYRHLKNNHKFEFEFPNHGGEYLRSNLPKMLKEVGFLTSEKDFRPIVNSIYIKLAQERIRETGESEDKLLIHAVISIEELDESISKLSERIREWYAIHFPEMDVIKNHSTYVGLIAEHGHRTNIIKNLDKFNVDIKTSAGIEIEEEDVFILRNFALSLKSLQDIRITLEKYVENKMSKIAPNLKEICGAVLGAKLIAHVGSIEQLAKFPSSTIQILGAEKALFRHLKTGERPPKHGIIYQHPEIRGAKWWMRGKIARAYAAKISLAVIKDVFSGEFDPQIKKELMVKLDEIKKENPFPKRTSKRKIKKREKKHRKRKKK